MDIAGLHDVMELLVASWLLSADDPEKEDSRSLPTSHGVLDRALQSAMTRGAFPAWNGIVHFVDSRIGMQCVELPEILTLAQRSELTAAPNPSYRTTHVKLSASAAQRLLRRSGVKPEDARVWGEQLRRAVREAEQTLREYPASLQSSA